MRAHAVRYYCTVSPCIPCTPLTGTPYHPSAIKRLARPVTSLTEDQWRKAVPLDKFRRLLPDYATLLGNDFFGMDQPGFNKIVTLRVRVLRVDCLSGVMLMLALVLCPV
jgi:hypothetical protein